MATSFTPGCFKYVTVADLRSLMSASEREICTFSTLSWLRINGQPNYVNGPLLYQRQEETLSQGSLARASASSQWSIGEMFSLASWASSLSDITMIYINSDSESEQTPSSHSHASLEQLELDTDHETADGSRQ